MLRFAVGMSLFFCLLNAADAAPHAFSARIDPESLRLQEQVAASARAFRSAVYTRYRTDRQAFDHYWTAGEKAWQAWSQADYPSSHADAVKTWFDNAAAIAGASRFGALQAAPSLPVAEVKPAPFRSVAAPHDAFRQTPAQPAGEVVFPTTPSLPRQSTTAPSQNIAPHKGEEATTPQFLTNPTPVDANEGDQANPFEATSDDSQGAAAEPENASWLKRWKRALFTTSPSKPTPQPAAAISQDLEHSGSTTD